MSIFKNPFKRKTAIQHNPNLINKLKSSNINISKITKDIENKITSGNTYGMKENLRELRSLLVCQFMREDIELYVYIKQYYKETILLELFEIYERDIKVNKREILLFFEKYLDNTDKYNVSFENSFRKICKKIQNKTILTEGHVYELYIK